jgi:hypothetical protein
MSSARGVFSLAVVAVLAPGAPCQTWNSVSVSARAHHAMVTDIGRQRVVMFGGRINDTHEWDGLRWNVARPAHRPPARAFPGMAYDIHRRRCVLFGGDWLADTWEWDGTDWTRRTPPTSPPGRSGHQLGYDPMRGRTVLFGGYSIDEIPFADTWEWDGTTWTRVNTASGPTARGHHAMAFDWPVGKVLMFGGSQWPFGYAPLNETWTWDGTTWSQLAPASSPSPRCATMSSDLVRQRIVLHSGGQSMRDPGLTADTWEWDGFNWIQMTLQGPSARVGHGMALDPLGRMLVSGGMDMTGELTDLWAWDGTAWTALRNSLPPSRRWDHAMAYDAARDQVVLFGGSTSGATLGDTWLWDGSAWNEVTPAVSPPVRAAHVMAFDPVRQRVVLFGGNGRNDTWEWDGTSWLQRSPTTPPPVQARPAMVWDAARQRVFLYGSDNFEWDGSQWTQRPSPARPASTRDMAMAFDPRRGRVLLFGGQSWAVEMWEWDGVTWTPVAMGPVVPPARRAASLVFDPILARMLLFGGINSLTGFQHEVWQWDGTTWTNRWLGNATTSTPQGRFLHAMVHDTRRGRSLMFGGGPAIGFFDDTWELAVAAPAAGTAYGSGCAGSAGQPVLGPAAWQLPWVGEPFTVEVRPTPAATVGVILTGMSRTSWLGLVLPLDLSGAGMPGCALLASGQLVGALSIQAGVGAHALTVPRDGSLVGTSFFQQAVIADAAANAAGLIVSNGLGGRFGQR